MDLQIKNKRALVTASTSGIGLAIAQALAAEGARVIVNGRTQERVNAALAQVEGQASGVAADLSTAAGCEQLFAAAGEIDILVNNLGIFEMKPFLALSDDDWLQTLQTNFLSGVRVTRHYLPGMLDRRWGRILFLASDSGVQIPADAVHYGVSKAAVFAVARGIAESIPASGVTVNSLIPGPTRTELIDQLVAAGAAQQGVSVKEFKADFMKNSSHANLTRRFAAAQEVAAMAAYLCSERASATTGSPVRVDGGSLRSAF